MVGCIFQHMQTVAFPAFSSLGEGFHSRAFSSCMADIINYRSQPRLLSAPNHARRAADSAAGRKGWRSQTEGEKQGAPGGKLAFIRAVQAFSCPAGVRGSFQFYFSSFSVHNTGSLVLSLYAPRYCLSASAGFGRQFTKLRALSRLRRRYDSRKYRNPPVL